MQRMQREERGYRGYGTEVTLDVVAWEAQTTTLSIGFLLRLLDQTEVLPPTELCSRSAWRNQSLPPTVVSTAPAIGRGCISAGRGLHFPRGARSGPWSQCGAQRRSESGSLSRHEPVRWPYLQRFLLATSLVGHWRAQWVCLSTVTCGVHCRRPPALQCHVVAVRGSRVGQRVWVGLRPEP